MVRDALPGSSPGSNSGFCPSRRALGRGAIIGTRNVVRQFRGFRIGGRRIPRADIGRVAAIVLWQRRTPMLRHALVGLAAATLLSATLIPDDASARGGRGGGARAGGAGVRGA